MRTTLAPQHFEAVIHSKEEIVPAKLFQNVGIDPAMKMGIGCPCAWVDNGAGGKSFRYCDKKYLGEIVRDLDSQMSTKRSDSASCSVRTL